MHFDTCCHQEHVKAHGSHFDSSLQTAFRRLGTDGWRHRVTLFRLRPWLFRGRCRCRAVHRANCEKSEGGMGISHRGSPILGDWLFTLPTLCRIFPWNRNGSWLQRIFVTFLLCYSTAMSQREVTSGSHVWLFFPCQIGHSRLMWPLPFRLACAPPQKLRWLGSGCELIVARGEHFDRPSYLLTLMDTPLNACRKDCVSAAGHGHEGLTQTPWIWPAGFSVQQVLILVTHGCDNLGSRHANGYIMLYAYVE